MKGQRRRKKTYGDLAAVFLRITLGAILTWMVLLGITLSLTLNQALNNLQEKIESDLQATAFSLAESDMVRSAFAAGACPAGLIEYLDTLVLQTDDLDIITIADRNSLRLYHVVHARIGEAFVGGDQGRALAGEAYLSEGVGTMGLQRRAFCPVRDRAGTVCGFVMASATMDRIQELQRDILLSYLKLALILVLVTLAAAGGMTVLSRRLLLGFSPEELVHFYLAQNEVLDSLDEGLISVDASKRVQLVNRAAETMLGLRRELLEGQELDVLLRESGGGSLLDRHGENVSTTRPNILASCIPRQDNAGDIGTILILKDKSDAMRQAEQLSGAHHIVTALRANTHEFMNKLQVISGFLKMGQKEEAEAYIGAISAVQSKYIGPVLQYIQNPNVAALLLGKLDNMRELNIGLTLLTGSSLPEHSEYLSTEELVTVVGNLTENAIEAINAQYEDSPRSIALQITEDGSGLLIMISDTGAGIAPEHLDSIYNIGFSTKAPEGRGTGMALIQAVVQRRNGSIEVDSEPGTGTTFTLIFNQKRTGGMNA